MSQSTFSDLAPEPKKKVTRKERFLNEMDAVVQWQLLLEPIRQCYSRAARGRGKTLIGLHKLETLSTRGSGTSADSCRDAAAHLLDAAMV